MSSNVSQADGILKAHVTSLRLLYATWIAHFKSLGYIKESTLEKLDRTICKRTLELTIRDEKIRWEHIIRLQTRAWTNETTEKK